MRESGEGTTADELWEVGGRDAIVEHLRDLSDSRLEARHILTLIGAMAGIAVTAAALWMPQHLN